MKTRKFLPVIAMIVGVLADAPAEASWREYHAAQCHFQSNASNISVGAAGMLNWVASAQNALCAFDDDDGLAKTSITVVGMSGFDAANNPSAHASMQACTSYFNAPGGTCTYAKTGTASDSFGDYWVQMSGSDLTYDGFGVTEDFGYLIVRIPAATSSATSAIRDVYVQQ